MLCKTMLPSNESRHTVTPKPKEKGTRSRTLILQCYIIILHLLPPSFLTGHITKEADQFRLPPIVEDDPVYSAVIPHHFELAYTKNCHYDCIVDKKSGELCTTTPEILVQHKFNLELHVNCTATQCLTFLALVFRSLICTLHHQLVMFTW